MAIFFFFVNTWVSENELCCIFCLFWFIPLGLIRGKKLLDEVLRQAGVKQKCCVKYPFWEKISFFTISKTSGWLFSGLKSHLLITYLWLYVRLINFPWKNKNKNYAGLGGCLLRWINICFYQHNSSYLTKPYQELIHDGLLALFNNCLVECQNIFFLYWTH